MNFENDKFITLNKNNISIQILTLYQNDDKAFIIKAKTKNIDFVKTYFFNLSIECNDTKYERKIPGTINGVDILMDEYLIIVDKNYNIFLNDIDIEKLINSKFLSEYDIIKNISSETFNLFIAFDNNLYLKPPKFTNNDNIILFFQHTPHKIYKYLLYIEKDGISLFKSGDVINILGKDIVKVPLGKLAPGTYHLTLKIENKEFKYSFEVIENK